ncbi:hypothetical protein BpHYR1_001367 [Brachionus plicatilis]|uniref:Uncharacterized protein n=1 Tax=Brachionus plicatilis TaxID=10195 RepID=A0A3M7SK25_BRAPC|nr:hypothetical protein BpHYR1_001367 [Brachionus plicatilis]
MSNSRLTVLKAVKLLFGKIVTIMINKLKKISSTVPNDSTLFLVVMKNFKKQNGIKLVYTILANKKPLENAQ